MSFKKSCIARRRSNSYGDKTSTWLEDDSCLLSVFFMVCDFSYRVFHHKNRILNHVSFCDLLKNHQLIVVLVRNKKRQKIIQQNIPLYDEYGKHDELCSKIHYKFEFTKWFKVHCKCVLYNISIQFNDFSLANYFSLNLHAWKFCPSVKNPMEFS